MDFFKKISSTCYYIFSIFLLLSACSSPVVVQQTSDFKEATDKTVSTLISSGDVNSNWRLLLNALQRLNITIDEKNAEQYELTTQWIPFVNDPKTKSINMRQTIRWSSQGTRERHKFQLNLVSDTATDGVLLTVLDLQRQLEVDLSDGAVTYLQWREYPTLRSVAVTFMENIQPGVQAVAQTELKKSFANNTPSSKPNSDIDHNQRFLHYADVNKDTLWQAVRRVLNEENIQFTVLDDSQKTIATQWSTYNWDAENQQLTKNDNKETVWAFNLSGKGQQQHRFNIEIHDDRESGAIIDVYHKGWREQVDLTPDASITSLEWQKRPVEEKVAEAFLKRLSVKLSSYLDVR